MLENISKIWFPKNCLFDIYNFRFFLLTVFFLYSVLVICNCSIKPSCKSPKALIKTFCLGYNQKDDCMLRKCGDVDYIIKQIAVEKYDEYDKPYCARVEELRFEILNVNKGRIGLQSEYSNKNVINLKRNAINYSNKPGIRITKVV